MLPTSAVRPPARRSGQRLALGVALLMLCAGALRAAIRPEAAAPVLSVEGERTPQGAKLALQGSGWPARVTVALSATTPPGGAEPLDLGTTMTSASGELRATKRSPCSTSDSAAAQRSTVTVTARTADGAAQAQAQLTATPWACLSR